MDGRGYGIVAGAAIVILAVGLGSGTGLGSIGTVSPSGPMLQLPRYDQSRLAEDVSTAAPTPIAHPQPVLVIPAWVYSAMAVLVGCLALLLLGWFVWLVSLQLQRGRRIEAAEANTAGTEIEAIPMSSISATLTKSLGDLRGGLDTDDVILECWRRLESLGEQSGARRRDSDTSTEYVERLLSGTPEAATELAELARLYRAAMFSGLSSDSAARSAAIDCLEHLSSCYGRGEQ